MLRGVKIGRNKSLDPTQRSEEMERLIAKTPAIQKVCDRCRATIRRRALRKKEQEEEDKKDPCPPCVIS
jgi:hypothetical protein